jgi:hypothetical protein
MEHKTFQNTTNMELSLERLWPASLDALVAAPRNHRKIFENDRVRILEAWIARGETVPVHTHRWPGVLLLQSWSEHVGRDETGRIIFDSREAGPHPDVASVVWCEPLPPHSVENVGDADLRVLRIELKDFADR